MSRSLKIRILEQSQSGDTFSHRFWVFGEGVYRYCRDTQMASITLAEVDESTDSLVIRSIKARDLRTVEKFIRELLQRHHFERYDLTVEVEI